MKQELQIADRRPFGQAGKKHVSKAFPKKLHSHFPTSSPPYSITLKIQPLTLKVQHLCRYHPGNYPDEKKYFALPRLFLNVSVIAEKENQNLKKAKIFTSFYVEGLDVPFEMICLVNSVRSSLHYDAPLKVKETFF